MQPYAMWTDDWQGEKDFDGPLISVSTRYWPGPGPYGKQPSAHAAIILNVGPREKNDGGGDYLVWRDASFEAATESEVKAQVEAWVAARMADVVALLGGEAAFRNP